ncbi:helix-turn-helix domain-containing protein [Abditibacterium utsteinense]|nr:helix-turn-helix transcriptional regulator [Abditibacterium utsteinense]
MIRTKFEELRLKKLRDVGVTRLPLQQIAKETGLSFTTLQRLSAETNTRVDYATLDVLCRYFDCTVCELLQYVPNNQE